MTGHKYKIGDKVRIRNDIEASFSGVADEMVGYRGQIMTIQYVKDHTYGWEYKMEEDGGMWWWDDELFEEFVDYKPPTVEELIHLLGDV